jgi:bifunctional non-homologous end joining protein LigD
VTFAAFDVLHLAGESTIELPWVKRRHLLAPVELDGPAWCTVPTLDGDPDLVLDLCGQHLLEGLVAKRTDSTYRPGSRSRSWVKLKTDDWRDLHAPRRH